MILAARNLERWTPERGSAFNFATKIIRNRMIDAYDKEANWLKKKAISLEHAEGGTLPERYLRGEKIISMIAHSKARPSQEDRTRDNYGYNLGL